MSYLLIGNISALICDDGIEPLANAQVRVYLPELSGKTWANARKDMYNDLRQLTDKEVAEKGKRLLAEGTLDTQGNFSISWPQIHLFTEPLEIDVCIDCLHGKQLPACETRHYHLSSIAPHWKKNTNGGYVAAYAYVIPSDKWNALRASFNTWVITGTVRFQGYRAGQPMLKIEAFNARNGSMLGCTYTNAQGRFKLNYKNIITGDKGRQSAYRQSNNAGPDVYFKVYREKQLIWEESERSILLPGRKAIAPCTTLNIVIKPSVFRKATSQLSNWLNVLTPISKSGKGNFGQYGLCYLP
ncbi:hypothetical protein KTO58_10340 [Chitinophaga pendula]|uniref:hypothetical protein n=1 Tax=Chitinophaga TaxID=79328 RepID=UPI000BAE9C5C|nr:MULTISPECIES: hypothetical protein [Chitinophaga]ASZ12813.1 hypothetical protein CK934_18555 [Chitinophaga sp. MD30]UCJ09562.1 hypothetical protein KTO58_10340 [Chitinophaga pendula]